MSARVDADVQTVAPGAPFVAAGAGVLAPLAPLDLEDRWGGHALPSDHPHWMKDTLSISQRARALLAKLKPVAVRVVAYWEHQVRSIVVGTGRLSVDASGSYRLE